MANTTPANPNLEQLVIIDPIRVIDDAQKSLGRFSVGNFDIDTTALEQASMIIIAPDYQEGSHASDYYAGLLGLVPKSLEDAPLPKKVAVITRRIELTRESIHNVVLYNPEVYDPLTDDDRKVVSTARKVLVYMIRQSGSDNQLKLPTKIALPKVG